MIETSPVQILFGAGGIGKGTISYTWVTGEQTSSLLETLSELKLSQLDSAAAYPSGAAWVTEGLLGGNKAAEKGFVIDTKILIVPGALSEGNIDSSIKKSLELLGVDKVNILYAHAPDNDTPIEESARAFDKQYRAGHCKKLGLCNYNLEQLQEWFAVCEKNNYVKPSVYQGHYNAIIRKKEEKLFPFLREHNVKIYAYGPLAGGFLTGKVSLATEAATLSGGRWDPGRFPIYPQRFDKPVVHNAMIEYCKKCEGAGLTPTEVSLRWIMHHSALGEGDGIILGATKVDQLKSNVECCRKGPLSKEMLAACDELWEKVKNDLVDLFD